MELIIGALIYLFGFVSGMGLMLMIAASRLEEEDG